MGQLLPYAPLPPDVTAAMEKLQRADTFDAQAFAILDRERWTRAFAFLACVVPSGVLGLGLIWLIDLALSDIALPMFVYAFGAFLLAICGHHLLRLDAFMDDQKLGAVIERWEMKGGRIRDKPPERRA